MTRFSMILGLCSILAAVGCDSGEEYTEYELAPQSENTDEHAHHHDHEGKHGGTIIEFDAAHANHAEIVFDSETRGITMYFYGAEIGRAKAVSDVVFELEEGDDEVHLDVTASPLEGESEESSSCFTIAGDDIPEGTKSLNDLHGHFHVTIGDQDYKGNFGHDHNHEGHEHGDEDHGHGEEDHDHGEHDHEHGEHQEGDSTGAE